MTKLNEWKHDLGQAWESLAEGWRELGERASGALTRFRPGQDGRQARVSGDLPPQVWPVTGGWAFLAADVFDDDDRIMVRLEAPGLRREDFEVELQDDLLTVRGQKHFERENSQGSYRLIQCAYGSFRRDVRLPVAVRADLAKASYRDGVLRIECPKAEQARTRRIAVQSG